MADANAVKGHGVQTVVEPSAMFLHRDAAFSKRVADESGLNVDPRHRASTPTTTCLSRSLNRNEDQLAEIFVHDIEHGHPGHRTSRPPSSSAPPTSRASRRTSRRSTAPPRARRSRPAGRSWPTRVRPAALVSRQMKIFAEEGVDPAKVQVAHTGDTDDLDYIGRLLDTGCWIGMDRYGLDIFLPTEQRQATMLALLEKGHAEHMFLSQDWCSTLDWFTAEVEEQLPAATAAPELVDDVPVRTGHPRAEGARNDRRAARPDDGREPEALARLRVRFYRPCRVHGCP